MHDKGTEMFVARSTYPLDETANDRLKRSYGAWLWVSMIVATVAHSAVLAAWPSLEVEPAALPMHEIEAIELPPEITIPLPPEAIARPANPVVTSAEIDMDVTIAPTTFESNPISDLPPPPTDAAQIDLSAQPSFTPYEVAPEITNRAEVQEALVREYPAVLRDMGVGGTVFLHFYIDAAGSLANLLVAQSSGFSQLDEAALRVAQVFRFSAALNRDQRVPVWIQVPITFRTD